MVIAKGGPCLRVGIRLTSVSCLFQRRVLPLSSVHTTLQAPHVASSLVPLSFLQISLAPLHETPCSLPVVIRSGLTGFRGREWAPVLMADSPTFRPVRFGKAPTGFGAFITNYKIRIIKGLISEGSCDNDTRQ